MLADTLRTVGLALGLGLGGVEFDGRGVRGRADAVEGKRCNADADPADGRREVETGTEREDSDSEPAPE